MVRKNKTKRNFRYKDYHTNSYGLSGPGTLPDASNDSNLTHCWGNAYNAHITGWRLTIEQERDPSSSDTGTLEFDYPTAFDGIGVFVLNVGYAGNHGTVEADVNVDNELVDVNPD